MIDRLQTLSFSFTDAAVVLGINNQTPARSRTDVILLVRVVTRGPMELTSPKFNHDTEYSVGRASIETESRTRCGMGCDIVRLCPHKHSNNTGTAHVGKMSALNCQRLSLCERSRSLRGRSAYYAVVALGRDVIHVT